jgi:hypothetical protein
MAVFNQAFYDLNNKRCYCLRRPDADFPLELISDLKISVPNQTEVPAVQSIFIKDNCVRMTITSDSGLILSYTSDDREFVRNGRTYPLKSHAEGYDGVIVFGKGIRHDCNFQTESLISEECITRYSPSRIPYVSLTCIGEQLTGEVWLGGDDTSIVQSDAAADFDPADDDEDYPVFGEDSQAVRIDLVDTFRVEPNNPMIQFANGINAYNEVADRSPVYTIGNIHPDATGTVTIQFEDHFSLAGIVTSLESENENGNGNGGEEETKPVVACAVGSDISPSDVCSPSKTEPDEGDEGSEETEQAEKCDISEIQAEIVPYE